jgi:hypothetical protein
MKSFKFETNSYLAGNSYCTYSVTGATNSNLAGNSYYTCSVSGAHVSCFTGHSWYEMLKVKDKINYVQYKYEW